MIAPLPPLDPEIAQALAAFGGAMPTLTPDLVLAARQSNPTDVDVNGALRAAGVGRHDHKIGGHNGGEITLSVLRPSQNHQHDPTPAVYYIHGGGMVFGNRFTGITQFLPWITELGATVITVEYRLAPEHPDPHPVEDCYAGLIWTATHATDIGIDASRLLVAGGSAGGGLAAGAALLARDRNGPHLVGQLLMYPMLDDRDDTPSTLQMDGGVVWDRASNVTGWTALLGDRRGGPDVSGYAAPARATDLAGLPPAYIDCGTAEVFRDEDVAYASALWRAGVQVELHVWPGGVHGFDLLAPSSALAGAMVATRQSWLAKTLIP